ncbi:MAG: glycosyltransferase [Solirubrobacteraceae bacterium]|nr:glycosyltransferase [Solirubrobacteraceae bacterium]
MTDPASPRPVRVLRIIARMNLGGPAHHVSILGGRLPADRYTSLLLTGRPQAGEESGEDLAEARGASLQVLHHLGPELSPVKDARAFIEIRRVMRRFRPDVVHTHTAKAGALGRLAALTMRPRPIIVHTFHGHVLRGYFGRAVTGVYRVIERVLGTRSDRLIGVSQATVDELVALGVAPAERFEVIELGLDLDEFLAVDGDHTDEQLALRKRCGAGPTDVVGLFVGRLVPIKRVDVLLEALVVARAQEPRLRALIVGDGPLRGELEAQARALGLGDAVAFLGYRRDLATLAGAADIAMLSSDNEGTPVALIESAAAGRALVSTDVGGVASIVTAETGLLVAAGDARGLGNALALLASDDARRSEIGRAARRHVRARWDADRLVADVDDLYRRLLRDRTP